LQSSRSARESRSRRWGVRRSRRLLALRTHETASRECRHRVRLRTQREHFHTTSTRRRSQQRGYSSCSRPGPGAKRALSTQTTEKFLTNDRPVTCKSLGRPVHSAEQATASPDRPCSGGDVRVIDNPRVLIQRSEVNVARSCWENLEVVRRCRQH
jgi:hypothetical protein